MGRCNIMELKILRRYLNYKMCNDFPQSFPEVLDHAIKQRLALLEAAQVGKKMLYQAVELGIVSAGGVGGDVAAGRRPKGMIRRERFQGGYVQIKRPPIGWTVTLPGSPSDQPCCRGRRCRRRLKVSLSPGGGY